VTGLLTGKLYKFDIAQTSVIHALEVGVGPNSMLVVDDKLYVTISGFTGATYLQGRICIIDLKTFAVQGYIEVSTNPQELIVDSNGFLHIVCTGNYAEQMTEVVIVDLENHEVVETLLFTSFYTTIQFGADGMVYVGNGFGLGFIRYNPETFVVLNDYGDTLFSNGLYLLHDENRLFVLEPSWMGASKLSVFSHDFSPVHEVNLGSGSVSMVMKRVNVSISDIAMPSTLELTSFPNPFRSSIQFEIKGEVGESLLDIFNIKGQRVHKASGTNIAWHGNDVPAGVYFARMTTESGNIATRKIVKIK
jgi:hypothetical protein